MSNTIRDGKGKGYLASVNSHNQLQTRCSTVQDIAFHSANDSSAFVVTFEHTQASGGSTEGVGYMTYTGNKVLRIQRIIFPSL